MSATPATQRPIDVLNSPPEVTVAVPGSKSHTNRALVCAALARGVSTLSGVLFADDTEAMLELLPALGIDVTINRDAHQATVAGCHGRVPSAGSDVAALDARQSGTTSRFVLPMLTLGAGRYVLDGDPQMRARPFGDLIGALHDLGARIEGDRLPLTVHAGRESALLGGAIEVPGSVSSQFLSGLLLSAPCAAGPTTITVTDELVSKPYIDLTLDTMRSFGVEVSNDSYETFEVPAVGYQPAQLALEPDASAASYFFAAAAITGGRIRVPGLDASTRQGDLRFVDLLEQMGAEVVRGHGFTEVRGTGALRGIEVDMADISDTAQSLAAVAPFAEGPTRVTGIGFIRKKETDRIHAVVTELRRLGIDAVEDDDGFTIHPGPISPALVHTYDDHRMAMSFALIGLRAPGVVINDPGCVSKTFPDFFEVLAQLY